MSAAVVPITETDPKCPDCGAAEIVAYSDGSLACMWCKAPIRYEYIVSDEHREDVEARVREYRRLGNEALAAGNLPSAWFLHGVANHFTRGLRTPEERVEQSTLFDIPVVLRGDIAERLASTEPWSDS